MNLYGFVPFCVMLRFDQNLKIIKNHITSKSENSKNHKNTKTFKTMEFFKKYEKNIIKNTFLQA